jgi:hypothetical protein
MVDSTKSNLDMKDSMNRLQRDDYLKEPVEKYKKYVKAPKFVCKKCGRTAIDENNLCGTEDCKSDPIKL